MKEEKTLAGVKKNSNGEYEVRLNYLKKRYSVVNYTKKYGCKNIEDVEEKIKEFKKSIFRGDDPFDKRTFGDYMNEYYKKLSKKKSKSAYNYQKMYEKYAKYHLHHLQPDEISNKYLDYIYEDMIDKQDIKGNYEINSIASLQKLKGILSPTFKLLHNKNKIKENYLETTDFPELDRHTELAPLNIRLKDQNYIEVVRKLFKSIQKVKNVRSRMYLLFTLMTMRRKEETFNITKENIYSDIVYSLKDMTKSKIDERFLLPKEIQDYVESIDNEFPLKCVVHKYLEDWQNVLTDAEIGYIQTFRVYDTRHLFMSIMKKYFNRELVGACISHYKGDTNEIYSSYEFEDRKEVMRKWWKILRNEESFTSSN